MQLFVIGSDHHISSIKDLTKCSMTEKDLAELYAGMNASSHIKEFAPLMTCNRVEIYVVPAREGAENYVIDLVSRITGSELFKSEDSFYLYRDIDAAEHLFRVAAGMESQVIGEPEILGQIKRSIKASKEKSASGAVLIKLFDYAIRVGKRVRTTTDIGKGNASFGSVSLDKAYRVLGSLANKHVLLIGTGEISRSVAEYLKKRDFDKVYVASRTKKNAMKLAKQLSGTGITLGEISGVLPEVDIVISAVRVDNPIISPEHIDLHSRSDRQLVIIDLGMPRNISPEVDSAEGVRYFDMGSLNGDIKKAIRRRKESIPQAEKIISEDIKSLSRWHRNYKDSGLLSLLIDHFDSIRSEVIEANRSVLSDLELNHVDRITNQMMRKLLHQPLSYIKSDDNPHREMLIKDGVIHRMFGLEDKVGD